MPTVSTSTNCCHNSGGIDGNSRQRLGATVGPALGPPAGRLSAGAGGPIPDPHRHRRADLWAARPTGDRLGMRAGFDRRAADRSDTRRDRDRRGRRPTAARTRSGGVPAHYRTPLRRRGPADARLVAGARPGSAGGRRGKHNSVALAGAHDTSGGVRGGDRGAPPHRRTDQRRRTGAGRPNLARVDPPRPRTDRKSTRLNSSHSSISYAVFCLKKKKKNTKTPQIFSYLLPLYYD